MTDFARLYQEALEQQAAAEREREWKKTLEAVKARDLPLIGNVRVRCVPTWEDDVLPRFRRWDVIAQRYHFGDWARHAYLMDWDLDDVIDGAALR